ncbi:MAG: SRPBCC domain-containing protein [Cyclobacteriaceae bacterium]|nr:SRPBCC domain-containing protein [Cyclobacteriaceae bacterium]
MKKVEASIDINTSPEKIIQAFTDSDMLRGWWSVERTLIEKRTGGLYVLAWNITDKGFGYVSSGVISRYEPGSMLEIDHFVYLNPERSMLGGMKLTVTATEKDGGSALYLCQSGYQNGTDWDWYYEAVKQAWPAVVKNLKEYLERQH